MIIPCQRVAQTSFPLVALYIGIAEDEPAGHSVDANDEVIQDKRYGWLSRINKPHSNGSLLSIPLGLMQRGAWSGTLQQTRVKTHHRIETTV